MVAANGGTASTTLTLKGATAEATGAAEGNDTYAVPLKLPEELGAPNKCTLLSLPTTKLIPPGIVPDCNCTVDVGDIHVDS
jgi:hypothetical protein